jgi:hypothetical protein
VSSSRSQAIRWWSSDQPFIDVALIACRSDTLSLELSAEQISRLDTVRSHVPSAPTRTPVPWAAGDITQIVA